LAAVPGFTSELGRLDDAQAVTFEPGHAARSALLARALLAGPAAAQVKFVKRLAWRAEPAADSPASSERAVAAAPARSEAPTHIVYGGYAYRVGTEGMLIGRETDPQRRTLIIGGANSGVSRAHCEIVLRDGELKLRDLSSYGTFVNERKVVGETTLERADVIRIGSPGAELHVVSLEGGA
jgi:pSer/pThr/pTyr-binding forkhead associated (FHA) protein